MSGRVGSVRVGKRVSSKRVQYAALPCRRRRNSRTEVLLITSRDTGRWIIPKGWPAKGKPPHRSAAREAREEAGVIGKIKRRPLGAFFYKKRLKSGKVVVCEVQVFVMKVKRRRPSGWRRASAGSNGCRAPRRPRPSATVYWAQSSARCRRNRTAVSTAMTMRSFRATGPARDLVRAFLHRHSDGAVAVNLARHV